MVQSKEREKPYSKETEQAILGVVMLENDTYFNASSVLKEDSFYFENHRQIWNAMTRLTARSEPIDAFMLLEELTRTNHINEALNKDYLVDLTSGISSSYNLESHIKIVEQKAMSRRLLDMCMKMQDSLYRGDQDVMAIVAQADAEMLAATEAIHAYKDTSIDHVGLKALEQLEKAIAFDGIIGTPTGIESIDRILGGWRPGRIYTIGARTRMGKSAVAAAFAYNAATYGDHCVIFSMEMEDVELLNRLAAIRVRELGHKIPYSRIDKGHLTKEEVIVVREAINDVRQLPIDIDDTPYLNAMKVKAKLSKMVRKKKTKVAFLDFVQIADLENKNTADGLSNFMTQLKNMAKELQIAIVPLSQIDRMTEKHGGNGRPGIADLKGSGGLEEKSDVIMLLTRPEVIDPDAVDPVTGNSERGIMYIDIVKHKMGETGLVKEPFDVSTNFFAPLAEMLEEQGVILNGQLQPAQAYEQSSGYNGTRNNQNISSYNTDDDPPF